MALYRAPAQTWPNLAGWLVPGENCSTLGYAIVQRAFDDIGILEVPLASNRGVRIERYLRRAGVPEDVIAAGKGWWCAAFVGAVFVDCGVPVPSGYASCDAWLPYVEPEPAVGHAVLYGVRGDAHHIGIVVRLEPMVLTIEGNRAFAGTTNNGVACDLGPMLRSDILGYVNPQKLLDRYKGAAA